MHYTVVHWRTNYGCNTGCFSAKFQNFGQISELWPNFRIWPKFSILAKFQNLGLISELWPNFRIRAKFQNFGQISEFWTNFIILAKFQNFGQISEFPPNFKILTKFLNFDKISKFWQHFKILTNFQNFGKISELFQSVFIQSVFCEMYPKCVSSELSEFFNVCWNTRKSRLEISSFTPSQLCDLDQCSATQC